MQRRIKNSQDEANQRRPGPAYSHVSHRSFGRGGRHPWLAVIGFCSTGTISDIWRWGFIPWKHVKSSRTMFRTYPEPSLYWREQKNRRSYVGCIPSDQRDSFAIFWWRFSGTWIFCSWWCVGICGDSCLDFQAHIRSCYISMLIRSCSSCSSFAILRKRRLNFKEYSRQYSACGHRLKVCF